MRRKDREVTDVAEIEKILRSCKTCHVAMIANSLPYVVPLSYGFKINDNILTLYFHSAKAGKKIDALQKNNKVCFSITNEGELEISENACNSGYFFASVVGNGEVSFISEVSEKCHALSLMYERQTNSTQKFTEEQASNVAVFKIVSSDYTGKQKTNKGVKLCQQ